jgi:UrcA family protein
MNGIVIRAAIGLFAAALISGIAIAQNTEVVTVEASRAVSTKTVGYTTSHVPINEVSLSYRVKLSDLDLASNAGATELEKRVNDAAKDACKELTRQYPNATPSDIECAKAAVDKAMVDVRNVIAAAQKKATK